MCKWHKYIDYIKTWINVWHTTSISHAVKEDPGPWVRPIFDKRYIMASVYTEDCKQLHLVSLNICIFWKVIWNCKSERSVFLSGGMNVNLQKEYTYLGLTVSESIWIKKCIVSQKCRNTKCIKNDFSIRCTTCVLQVLQYCLILPGWSLWSIRHWTHSCSARWPHRKHSRGAATKNRRSMKDIASETIQYLHPQNKCYQEQI